jgi:hypothetical protein
MNCFKLCSFQINFWVGTAVSAAPDRPPLADTRHKQTPVNHHFRSIPVSLQGSTWTNLRLGVVLAV